MTRALSLTVEADRSFSPERMSRPDAMRTVLAIVAASALSLLTTGYWAGDNNNMFHLPILEALWREPQFAQDPFIQSLRYYASGFWMLHVGVANDRTVMAFLTSWLIASRLLFFGGVAMMARPMGLEGAPKTIALLGVSACSVMLVNFSPAGDGGLMTPFFTHSELDNGLALIALGLAWRQRYGSALAVWGLAFFVNVFMAVWLAPLLLGCAWLHWRDGQVTPQMARRCWPGLLVCVGLVAPVLVNLAQNPEFGHKPDYDYRQFLIEYWPQHSIVWKLPFDELARFAICIGVGLSAAWRLPRPARAWMISLLALALAVWGSGAVLPLFTSSPALLNLHLLRSSAFVEILAALALNAAIIHLFAQGERLSACVLLVLAVSKLTALAAAIPLLWLQRRWNPAQLVPEWVLLAGLAGLAFGLAGGRIWTSHQSSQRIRTTQVRWIELARWAKAKTAPDTVFMLPSAKLYKNSPLPDSPAHFDSLEQENVLFPTLSHRQVWVTGKSGAVAMWMPSYYHVWRQRMVETAGLANLTARMTYARTHHIGVVIDECRNNGAIEPSFRAASLCAFEVK